MDTLRQKSPDEFVTTVGANIMTYAQSLGSFTRQQAYLMIPTRNNDAVDKLLFKLEKSNWIYKDPINEDHFTSSPYVAYDESVVKALWPVLIHKGDRLPEIDSGYWIGRGKYPAKVSYLLNGKFYDVMLLSEETKAILIYVEREFEKEQEENCGEHKYLFVVDNEEFVKNLPKISAPHYFVIVNEDNIDDPVRFIEPESNNKGNKNGSK